MFYSTFRKVSDIPREKQDFYDDLLRKEKDLAFEIYKQKDLDDYHWRG